MNRLYDNIILQKRFPGRVSSSNAIPKTAKGYGIATRPAFVNKEQIMLVYAIFYVLLIINLTKAAPHSGKTLGHSQNEIDSLEVLQTVVEKRATFACTPSLDRPGSHPHPGLSVCGDYIEGPYPATLEGAVMSGIQAILRA